jgi:hypothetical protein
MDKGMIFEVTFHTKDGIFPLTYTSKNSNIYLSLDNGEKATFIIDNLPTFLLQKSGLYQGKRYYPKIILYNQGYYLKTIFNDNSYYLENINTSNTDHLLSFSILDRVKWRDKIPLDMVLINNFEIHNSITMISFNRVPSTSERLTYSPSECLESCGDICPEGTVLNSISHDQCVNTKSGIAFELYLLNKDSKYKVSYQIRGNKLILLPYDPMKESPEVESLDLIRNKVFYIAKIPKVSESVYIYVDDQKTYLTRPVKSELTGMVFYLLSTKDDNSLCIHPQNKLYESITFNLDIYQFGNLILPFHFENCLIALKKIPTLSLPIQEPSIPIEESPIIPPENNYSDIYGYEFEKVPLLVNIPSKNLVKPTYPITPPKQKVRYYKTVWFWLFIALLILVLILILYIIWSSNKLL